MSDQKVTVIYTGRVQGVGFRMTVADLATGFAVAGSVCNNSDGSVELIAVGQTQELLSFLDAVRKRMERNIVGCELDWQTAQAGEFFDFAIVPDKLR